MPRILVFAATTGYQTHSFAQAADALGVDVILATDRCYVLENPWKDNAIAVRFDDPEASARIVAASIHKFGIDGIAAVGDRPTVTAAVTAARLDIPWHPPEAAKRCRDKHAMRERFRDAKLLVPEYGLIAPLKDKMPRQIGYPCVLKPLHLSASRGVIRANNEGEFAAALTRIRAIATSPSESIQVEKYIPGREFALEGIMTAGELTCLAIFDKPDPLTGPFFEETIYVTPSRESLETQAAMLETVRLAVRALGLWHGPIHAEMRVNAEGVWMLEIAARPIGGLCSRALRFRAPEPETPMTLEQLIVLHAVGRMPSALQMASPASGAMMIPVPRAGVFASVSGVDRAREVACIDDVVITAKPGEKLVPLPEGSSYTGFIFATGPAPAVVESALRSAHDLLNFEMFAGLPVIG